MWFTRIVWFQLIQTTKVVFVFCHEFQVIDSYSIVRYLLLILTEKYTLPVCQMNEKDLELISTAAIWKLFSDVKTSSNTNQT